MKKVICILLVFLMMLSASPLQTFAAKSAETSTFEMLSKPARPFILGIDDNYKEYIWVYDEITEDYVNTGIWYYETPIYGIKLKITYGDGTSEIISEDEVNRYFVCRVYEEPAAGTVKATLELDTDRYRESSGLKILTFQMDVVNKYVDSMEVLSAPAVVSYKGNDEITLEGMQLKINYVGGTSEVYEFGQEASDYGYISVLFHNEWIDVSWDEDDGFLGNSLPVDIRYLDCATAYELPLVDSPYASIEIVDCDFELINKDYGIYDISALTVKITRKDGTAITYNCESANSKISYSLPDDLYYEEYCVIEGHMLKISCVSYSDSHQTLLAKYVDVSDSYEFQDSRSQFEKFFDKIAIFFSEFFFKKLFYAFSWLF